MTLLPYVLKPWTLPPQFVCLSIAGISAFSLIAALIAQFGFDLRPCYLCLLQRGPFGLNILLGLYGAAVARFRALMIGLSGFIFLANSVIAFYHSGVERKWWAGLEGCSAPDMSGSVEELIRRIQEVSVVRCDEIPWSLFGLSMANYNVVMCLGLGVLCLAYVGLRKRDGLSLL
ncbi:MAG: disulfide bond formation protein B [Alphaproteobacteria bacterium]|nr:disulfide bond formation protein B [Alphaproteobacteria bacterium]